MNGQTQISKCNVFESFATHVWNSIIESHDVEESYDERGLTKDLIIKLRKAAKVNPALGVYANSSKREADYGSDIDILIEVAPNKFIWNALQAKLISQVFDYNKLDYKNQWDKLKDLRKLSGCRPYYLLYNGVADFKYEGRDVCNRIFQEDQYGCSLVTISRIEDFCSNKSMYLPLNGDDFRKLHPKYAQPWRILACCKPERANVNLFDQYQAQVYLERYKNLENNDPFFGDEVKSNLVGPLGYDLSAMVNVSDRADWNSDFTVVLKNFDTRPK